jgi:SAM-dependent methyltransferase
MKQSQKARFLEGEADAYFARNKSVLAKDEAIAAQDPVLPVLERIKPFPRRVLEIGCANGWRLNRMMALGATEGHGIDPSREAIEGGARTYPALRLAVGTADALPFQEGAFDLVVFGFCLYLCDPVDHFAIAAEVDRVLANEGHLVIYDFDPPTPYRNPYAHQPGLFSYKMDFSRLFLAHPHYQISEKRVEAHGGVGSLNPDNRVAVTRLTKSVTAAWPMNPWKA